MNNDNDSIIALIVDASGNAEAEWIARSDVAEYQRIVGGPIQMIAGDGWSAYLNEEGKIDDLPQNYRADSIARLHGWEGDPSDILAGTVIFLGPVDDDGYDTSADIELLKDVLGTVRF